jgi:hypothetical protein
MAWYKITLSKDDLYKMNYIKVQLAEKYRQDSYNSEVIKHVGIFGPEDESRDESTFYFTPRLTEYFPEIFSFFELEESDAPSKSEVKLFTGEASVKDLLI